MIAEGKLSKRVNDRCVRGWADDGCVVYDWCDKKGQAGLVERGVWVGLEISLVQPAQTTVDAFCLVGSPGEIIPQVGGCHHRLLQWRTFPCPVRPSPLLPPPPPPRRYRRCGIRWYDSCYCPYYCDCC